jgi:hypothetical protein
VVAEAYRHLVDGVEGMTGDLVAPRRLLTCAVDIEGIVDLRDVSDQEQVGLTPDDLTSEVGDWERCQLVGGRAHQLGRRGIIAPAATGLGETSALFTAHVSAAAMPLVSRQELWDSLPPDPRKLRIADDEVSAS